MNKELEEMIEQANRIEKEREDIETYFRKYLEQWIQLQHEVELLGRDDIMERYWVYNGIWDGCVHFTSPAVNDYDFRDSLILEEASVSIPFAFIEHGPEAYRETLKAIKAEQERRKQQYRADIKRRQAEAVATEAQRLRREAEELEANL